MICLSPRKSVKMLSNVRILHLSIFKKVPFPHNEIFLFCNIKGQVAEMLFLLLFKSKVQSLYNRYNVVFRAKTRLYFTFE
jgi:hypothetical protein